jgi:hypothetical protein
MSRPERNPLQAVLDRQLPREPAPVTPVPTEPKKFHRPVRDGRRFMGGHFSPKTVKAMQFLAVEEDTTIQALLEEAIDLLMVKKGKGRLNHE